MNPDVELSDYLESVDPLLRPVELARIQERAALKRYWPMLCGIVFLLLVAGVGGMLLLIYASRLSKDKLGEFFS